MDGELTPQETVALYALRNLPDSITQRIELLRFIIRTIKNEHSEVRRAATLILRHLLEHQSSIRKLQPELPLS